MVAQGQSCELMHDRPARASVKLEVESNTYRKAGAADDSCSQRVYQACTAAGQDGDGYRRGVAGNAEGRTDVPRCNEAVERGAVSGKAALLGCRLVCEASPGNAGR